MKCIINSLRRHLAGLLLFLGIMIAVIVISGGYSSGWEWTGLPAFSPSTPLPDDFEREKTLWDWLDLLIVPAVLAAGAFWFNHRTKEQDEKKEQEKFREEALQKYLDTMTTLLLDKHLMSALQKETLRRKEAESQATPEPNQAKQANSVDLEIEEVRSIELLRQELRQPTVSGEVIDVARVRTVNIVRRMKIDEGRDNHKLDTRRIEEVMDFLQDAGLYNGPEAILQGALMQGIDLHGIELHGISLRKAYLQRANLRRADLWNANLQDANLWETQLQNARLRGAQLQGATLQYANLEDAVLDHANLQKTELAYTNLQRASLLKADLQEAKLMDANLREGRLGHANLHKAFMWQANLQGAGLWNANIQEAFLNDANLQGANLHEANMQKADLRTANLQGANLEGANLQGANLYECKRNNLTILPDGTRWTRLITAQELTKRFGIVFEEIW